MNNLLITIFSMKENIYLAYWINPGDSTFQTVNFIDLTSQNEEEIPFLNDIEKIKRIFPESKNKSIFVDLIRNNDFIVIIFSQEAQFLPINKNIFMLLADNSLRAKKSEIENYLEEVFTETIDSEIQNILTEMHQDLVNYSSFISVFDYETDKLLGSTLHKNKEENILAKEVFKELKRLDLIKKIDLEVNLKRIGNNVQVFYFYIKNLVFAIYCINIQVNTGIIRLKLKTFLKNHSVLSSLNTQNSKSESSIKIVEPDFSDSRIKHFKMVLSF